MLSLADFPITRKWPPRHPDRIQLYSLPTPNGVKASIALEEMELAYEPHLVSFEKNDQLSPEFLSLNPNNKIPAIIDPNGPDGEPIALFESGAILVYLADKSGRLLPGGARRYETLQWLMFQMGGIGPMFGQVGFFHKFAGKDYEDKRKRGAFSRCSKAAWKAARGSWATSTPSPTSRPSPGCGTSSASTAPRTWSASTAIRTSRACSMRSCNARPCSAASRFRGKWFES